MTTEQSSQNSSISVTSVGIAIVAFAAAVWLLREISDVLVPVAVATIIWAIINGLSHAIRRLPLGGGRRVPEWLALVIAVLLSLVAAYFVGDLIRANAVAIGEEADTYQARLTERLEEINVLMAAWGFDVRLDEVVQGMELNAIIGRIASAFAELVGFAALILIYVIFLLVEQRTFRMKLRAIFQDPGREADFGALFKTLSMRIQEYIWVKTLMSLATALISYAVLSYFEIEFAGFWAFLIFLLNYVPTVGSILGIIIPSIQVLIQTDLETFLIIFLLLGVVPQFIIGNIVEPKVMGTSLDMSPIVILMSLAFWLILWGVPGLFLSVPLTVIIMIICAHFERTQWVAVLLSTNGEIVKSVRKIHISAPEEETA